MWTMNRETDSQGQARWRLRKAVEVTEGVLQCLASGGPRRKGKTNARQDGQWNGKGMAKLAA